MTSHTDAEIAAGRALHLDFGSGARSWEQLTSNDQGLWVAHAMRVIAAAHPPCTWTRDVDGYWQTACGQWHDFNDGGPAENRHKFCPYCGGALTVAEAAALESAPAGQMTLGKLIDAMEAAPAHLVVMFDDGTRPIGVSSYRGFYDQLAIEPSGDARDDTVERWHRHLSRAVGDTFEGYKGGHYRMTRNTPLWCSEWGTASDVMIVGAKVVGGMFVIETRKEEP